MTDVDLAIIGSGSGNSIPDDRFDDMSIAMFEKGARQDLIDREAAQIEVIKRYLPAEVGEADIERVVAQVMTELGATSKADMGRVIKEAKVRLGGGADGGAISRAVGARLK